MRHSAPYFVLAVFVGAASPAAAQQQAAPVERRVAVQAPKPQVSGEDSCIPLSMAGLMPTVPVRIGDRELTMAFDTGAPGGMVLSQQVVDELMPPKIGEARMSDPSGRNPVSTPLYRIDDVRIGKLEVDGWLGTSPPSHGPARQTDGVIGLSAFDGFVVTIDYPSGRLLLTRGRLPKPDGMTSFHYDGPIPSVPLAFDGQTVPAHIDTGNARYGLIVPQALAEKLPGFGERYAIGIAHSINNAYALMAVPLREAKVGDIPLHAGTTAFPSPADMGNLGSDLLRDMVVKVDPANGIVALARSAQAEDGCSTSG